jgi:cobalt-zinc-cadmium efflux system outer membrane protein
MQRLRSSRSDLVALRHRADSALATISATRRGVFPGFTLQLGGGIGASPGQRDLSVGVIAPIPIVDRGQGAVPASRARASAARELEYALLSPAELELAGAYASASQRRAALDAYKRATESTSEEMITQAQAGYLAGHFSVLELVDAYESLRDAYTRAIDLAQAARSAEVDVGRLIGASLRGTTQSGRNGR